MTSIRQKAPLNMTELVCLVAATMALHALTIDMMLAALGDISREFQLGETSNERQLVITVYLISTGATTLFFGPITDRFGRRSVFLWSIFGFVIATAICALASSFFALLLGRALQGTAASAGRVVAMALVRDVHKGSKMAQIMSMALTVSMVSPILAPALGQFILFYAPWRYVFGTLFLASALFFIWMYVRLPETLNPADQRRISLSAIARSIGLFIGHRVVLGYTMASVCLTGVLMAYIISAQQIYVDTYDLGARFALFMGIVAATFALAAFINASLVTRIGMRRLSHAALLAFLVLLVVNTVYLYAGGDSLLIYMCLLSPAFFCLALVNSNMSALVMEPLGREAGMVSSVYGFTTMTFGSVLGALAGITYDGTAAPVIACMAVIVLAALLIVIWTERGRLFSVDYAVSDTAE